MRGCIRIFLELQSDDEAEMCVKRLLQETGVVSGAYRIQVGQYWKIAEYRQVEVFFDGEELSSEKSHEIRTALGEGWLLLGPDRYIWTDEEGTSTFPELRWASVEVS